MSSSSLAWHSHLSTVHTWHSRPKRKEALQEEAFDDYVQQREEWSSFRNKKIKSKHKHRTIIADDSQTRALFFENFFTKLNSSVDALNLWSALGLTINRKYCVDEFEPSSQTICYRLKRSFSGGRGDASLCVSSGGWEFQQSLAVRKQADRVQAREAAEKL